MGRTTKEHGATSHDESVEQAWFEEVPRRGGEDGGGGERVGACGDEAG